MTKISPQVQIQNPIIKQDKYAGIPKPYMDVAEGMEAQFIGHMMAELQKTVEKNTPDTQAQAYYNSLLDGERAEIMAKTDTGVGLKEVILDQIYPKYMRKPIANNEAIGQYQNVSMKDTNSKRGDTNE